MAYLRKRKEAAIAARGALASSAAAAALGAFLAGCSTHERVESNGERHAAPATATIRGETDVPDASAARTPASDEEDALPVGFMGQPSFEDRPLSEPEGAELIPTGVRAAAHEGFDRVVIDFSGQGKPGWYARYTDEPTAQGSGAPVPYRGKRALVIGVEGTPWPSTPEMAEHYLEAGSFPGAGDIAGVELTGSFEAQSQFVIGVERPMAYAINFLEHPDRLVIDFLH